MKKYLLLFSNLALVLLLCITPAAVSPTLAAPTNDPIPSTPGYLHVQGTEVLDASGQPVLLRGFNFHTYYYNYLWDPDAPLTYATQEDIEFAKGLGANVIRLGFHWRYFDTALGFDLLDDYLDWCEQAGVYVILDMHVVPPEDDILEGAMWDDPAAQQQFLDLWESIATRYAGRTILAGYDLYNEPAPPDPDQWWDLAERAVVVIRAVDTNHIIFMEEALGAGFTARLLPDANVVYSFHEYEPFLVSHAGADWVGDSPVPSDYSYPGQVLTELNWADWAEDAASLDLPAPEWQPFDSGILTVPPGVEFATLKLSVSGQTGAVWFDDLELWHNGVKQSLYNSGMEEESVSRPGEPANWSFWSDSGVSGAWSNANAHSGARSMQLTGTASGFGVWTQSDWVLTAPLFHVQPGDTFQVHGWILAPQNNGSAQISLDYLNGVYENFDRDSLVAVMQPYLDWAATNNVPLFLGEFGAMNSAPGDSRYRLIDDTISVINEAGLHWVIWNYRDPSTAPGFGLYFDNDLDEQLADILRQGLGTSTTFVDVPLDYWANTFIERLYTNGITGGCTTSPRMYCPEASVTRAQMAVFLLVAKHGTGYTPPDATGAVFDDIAID
ncbi:MAG: cellulase family glycosylhydrolase, partial [Chloroflexota bacterium]